MANEITSQNLQDAIVKLVSADVLPALQNQLVMGNLVNRDFDAQAAQAGEVVTVPIAPNLVANNILEAGTVQNQNPALGYAQVILDCHAEATFTIPDITKVLAKPDLAKVYMESAMVAIGERIESDLMKVYPNLTYNAAIGSNATDISESLIDTAETNLYASKVPVGSRKNLVVSPNQYSKIRQIERFSEERMNGDGAAINTGTVGKLKDFDVYRSNFVPKVSGTVYNMAFHRDAIVLATRQLPAPMPGSGVVCVFARTQNGDFGVRILVSYNNQSLSQQYTVDVLYGVSVLRTQWAQVIQSQ